MKVNLTPKVTIITPVYNAEKTISVALNAVLGQNYENIQFVIVNDCSTDGSLQVVNDILDKAKRHWEVVIVAHDENKGVAEARNTGLNAANGEYIYFVDADDYIEPTTIATLVNIAITQNVDIVGCDWYLAFEKTKRRMFQPEINNPFDAISSMLNGGMRWNLWLYLVKRTLYYKNEVRFIPGRNMGEDLLVMMKLFVNAESTAHVPIALYHYGQMNENSLTKQYTKKHIAEVTENVEMVEKTLDESKYRNRIGDGISFLKLNIKLPLLMTNDSENYQLWKSWFPEADTKILKNRSQAFRIKLLQLCAARNQFWFVKLHYYVVVRFVYGVIFK